MLLDHSTSLTGKLHAVTYLKGECFESTKDVCSHLGTCLIWSQEEVRELANIFWFLHSDANTDFLYCGLFNVHVL